LPDSSQKFIGRNRPPRVHIEYDVETNGAMEKKEVPFVMGVLADLSGASADELPPVDERKPLLIDVDNFNDRLKAQKPRVKVTVPNTLTGEGNIAVDLTFESMDDFKPGAIAAKVEPLAKLLDARAQLANLVTFMDGRAGAGKLISQLLEKPELLRALLAEKAPPSSEAGQPEKTEQS
jgi:type VI secretion system protein ImpB